jgi:type IV pilus assembly protein PilB
MIDIGVPGYLVASSVIAAMAQRLVRVICNKCAEPHMPSDVELEAAGITPEMAAKASFKKGRGCNYCNNKGFRGRIGCYELMIMSSAIRELVFRTSSDQEIRRVALDEGMNTVYGDGIEKVCRGITTISEVFRVAKKQEGDKSLQALADAAAAAS